MDIECPKCGANSAQPVARCAACGLSLELLSQSLGSSLISLESLNDAAHCLRIREKEMLKHELDGFQQAFPQVFLAVYLGVLPTSPSPSEVAFWLLNHAAFQPADPARLNEHAALLVIDPVARQAGVTVGYGLEPFVSEAKLQGMLRRMRTPLWHGEYANAIEIAITQFGKMLRSAGKRTHRQVEFPPPGAEADFIHTSGLQSLRDTPAQENRRRQGGTNRNDGPLSP